MVLETDLIKIKSLDGQICWARWRFKFITMISTELLVIPMEQIYQHWNEDSAV